MSGELNVLDLLFIAILFFSFFFGVFRGLVRELLSLLVLVAALLLAFALHHDLGRLLAGRVHPRGLADFAALLLVLALAAAAGSLLAALLSRLLARGPLTPIDRLLGAAFGLLRGALLAGLVIYCFLAFPLNPQPLDRSQLAPVLTRAIIAGSRVLPPALRERLHILRIHDSKKDLRTGRTI
jgi:membrane protein required for colicin V production